MGSSIGHSWNLVDRSRCPSSVFVVVVVCPVPAHRPTKGVILTGHTRLRFGSVRFTMVHFGRMRGQNHYVSLRFNMASVDIKKNLRMSKLQHGLQWIMRV